MQARMNNPVLVIPEALQSLLAMNRATLDGGISERMLELVNMRASQINGCAVCLDLHARALKKMGESDERLHTLAGWRETPYFSDAERAALALTEAVTRLSDRANPVPDDVWDEAVRHYNEQELSALILGIGTINVFNRVNVATQQVAGSIPG